MPSPKWIAADHDRYLLYSRIKRLNGRAKKQGCDGRLRLADGRSVIDRDGGACAFCGAIWQEFDHRIPLSRGGINSIANLQLTCRPCNRRKNQRTADEFLRHLPTPICRNGHPRANGNAYLRADGTVICRLCRRLQRGRPLLTEAVA